MSAHVFDPEIAAQVGLNAAVIYQNIFFWVEKNAAVGRNFHEGRYWTRNSAEGFANLFPYLTPKQIRTALDKLEEAGLLVSGNFNKVSYDRTKWYSLPCQFDFPKKENGSSRDVTPIPDITTDITTDDKHTCDSEPSLFSDIDQPESQAERSGTAKKQKEDPIEVVLRSRLSQQAAADFIAHRKALKKPLTARAAELVIAKLDGCADPDAVVNASIMNGWQGVFPERAVPAPTAPPAYKPRERWYEDQIER